MTTRETRWEKDLQSTSAMMLAESAADGSKGRPSLVEMTREQYETMLRHALRRLRNTD